MRETADVSARTSAQAQNFDVSLLRGSPPVTHSPELLRMRLKTKLCVAESPCFGFNGQTTFANFFLRAQRFAEEFASRDPDHWRERNDRAAI